MEELLKQLQVMMQTIQTQGQRLDQAIKMLVETLASTRDLALKQQAALDTFQTTTKALEKSLEESDQQVDDMANITAALLKIQEQAAQEA